MARKHPILSLLFIILTIIGLFSFSKSLQASPTLSQIKQFDSDTELPYSHQKDENSVDHGYTPTSPFDVTETVDIKSSDTSIKAGSLPDRDNMIVDDMLAGKPIMAKMPNQTIRAEVGRAGWKMLHTILSQYPEEPTTEERSTLSSFIQLFSRVYPCRECAEHFQELLKKHPPQLRSRKNAVMWGCQAHNVVNRRLGKQEFDCDYIFDEYDCGCGSASDKENQSTSDSKEKTDIVPLEKGG